jgi:isopropylmalate/homocitrate/citramalate synthase
MPSPSLDSWLRRVADRDRQHAAALRAANHDRDRLADAVSRARAAGASWQDIADTLGVTKHAAHKRFAEQLLRQPEKRQHPLFD